MANLHGSHAGINKAMDQARTCVYWPGIQADVTDYIKQCLTCIESNNLPVEMLQTHEVPPGPWVKIGVDFFQDHLGKKTPNSSRLLQQVPIHVPSGICTSFQGPSHTWGNSLLLKVYPLLSCLTMDPHSMARNSSSLPHDFDFVHTTSSPHFHQSNGFIEAMVKKVKNAYKKTDGSPNAQARALLQLCDTPITSDLPSPAEISTWDILHKEQFFQDHQNMSIYPRFGRNSFNLRKNRKKTLTKPTEPKIYVFSR